MKKILGKIKKIFIMIEAFFLSISSKVWAKDDVRILYGIPNPETTKPTYQIVIAKMWDVMRWLVIPIVLLIGAIIYSRKHPKNLKIKIAIIVILTILICIEMIFLCMFFLFD